MIMRDEDYYEVFASNLKRLRKNANLTQKQLGLAIGVAEKSAENTVQGWEYKKQLPTLTKLRPLAQALGVTLDDLIP